MPASLTQDLAAKLQGAPAQQVAQQLGIDPAQASTAIGTALPLLLGALGRNASHPEGAQALFGALQNDHAGMDIGSVLGAVLGGGHLRGAFRRRLPVASHSGGLSIFGRCVSGIF